MFIGESLCNLRILYGYSRKQLSELIDVSEQAIWQYENGYNSPKYEVVQNLKTIFNVKSKYFYNEDSLFKKKQVVNENHIAYRSCERNSVGKTKSEAMHVEFLNQLVREASSKVVLPPIQLLVIRSYAIKLLSNKDGAERKKAIRQIAFFARNAMDLPNESNEGLMIAIEKSGVFVFEKAMGDKVDAYSLWTEDDVPYIILGNVKNTSARRYFDLAHELGHLLLHYKVEFNELDSTSYDDHEKEAHLFASCFLLPEVEFTSDFQAISRKSNPDSLIHLKRKWNVSIQAIAMRARDLSLITPEQSRYFWKLVSQKKYKNFEPLDDVLPVAIPMKFKSILASLSQHGILDIKDFVENEYHSEPEFFYRLTGIDKSFFEIKTIKQAATISNIREMKKRKSM